MKCLFDTSVLIAALLTGHTHHSACLPFLLQAQSQPIQGLIATHTLAELYSVLTRIPKTKISPAVAQNLIRDNLQTFETVSLTAEDYTAAIDLMVQRQLALRFVEGKGLILDFYHKIRFKV